MTSKLLLNCPDCVKVFGKKDDLKNQETYYCDNCSDVKKIENCMQTFPTIKRDDGSVRVIRDDGYEG